MVGYERNSKKHIVVIFYPVFFYSLVGKNRKNILIEQQASCQLGVRQAQFILVLSFFLLTIVQNYFRSSL